MKKAWEAPEITVLTANGTITGPAHNGYSELAPVVAPFVAFKAASSLAPTVAPGVAPTIAPVVAPFCK